jgi:hypothetical protein
MRKMLLAALAAVLCAGLLVACGDPEADEQGADVSEQEDGATPGRAMGPGLAVEEAQSPDAGSPVLVNGYIVAEGDVVRLCTVLLESFPPQCGEPSLQVVGLDLDEFETQSESGVTWTDQQVQVLGEVSDGVLTVDSAASA